MEDLERNKEERKRMLTPEHIIGAAAIAQLRSAGFAVVPRNATEAIVNAGGDKLDGGASLYSTYRAMVDAAQMELVHEHTTQALARLRQEGIEPTMTADEVLKLTREVG